MNASCKPGQWRTRDIISHRPAFYGTGKVAAKASLRGGTGWIGPHAVTDYGPHGAKRPLMFQDHGNPVRPRNVSTREMKN